jgi:hypothetical protein
MPSTIQTITLPSVQAYKDAFLAIEDRIGERYRALIQAHYHAPEHTITARQLAEAVGFRNFNAANLHYGRLAGYLRRWFDLRLNLNIEVLVSFLVPDRAAKEDLRWVMFPRVAQALEQLGWV